MAESTGLTRPRRNTVPVNAAIDKGGMYRDRFARNQPGVGEPGGFIRRSFQQDAINRPRETDEDETPQLTRAMAPTPQPAAPTPAPVAAQATPGIPSPGGQSAVSVRPGYSATPNQGGTITRGGLTRSYAASPANPRPPTVAATTPPPQTEARNPLSGASTSQPEGTTDYTPTTAPDASMAAGPRPAQAMGFAQNGNAAPRGQDAIPAADPNVGGTGIFARRFPSISSANLYSNYVRRLFEPQGSQAPV